MKALLVYESMWGNTHEIAEAVASGLARYATVTTVEVSEAPLTLPDDIDVVVAGGPSHAYALGLRAWLHQLPFPATAPVVALFDTRLGITRPLPSSVGRRAARVVIEHGYQVVTEPHSFFVHGHNGPLQPGERCRAALWGERVALETQLAKQPV